MKKYALVPYFFLFWCVADLFLAPRDLILTASAAAVLLLLLPQKERALWLSLAAAAAVGVGIYNVQFILRIVPSLALILAHAEVKRAEPAAAKQRAARREGTYTALLISFAAAASGLISDVAAFARLRARIAPTRLYWTLAGIVLFLSCLLFFGRPQAEKARKKDAKGVRQPKSGVCPVYLGACVCAAAAGAGCVLNGEAFGAHNVIFPWVIFLAVSAGTGDALQSAAGARFGGLLEKLFAGSE